ncbi:MAG: tRNA (adenosine(37)-N6)-threonylcarbamoyltransferase complex transferase subunit TsaD [Rhizobiaceae bacterium]|nr:tRNA (adenosine(37)-N6)-threonylcarbamoyltransferase complex transferase subunit TsaD [Rhizobiaceae bacterium]
MIFLGIETSCDETAASIVRRTDDGHGSVLSNVVHAQIAEHTPFGGVVPEIAARAHVERLDGVVARALADAAVTLSDIDGIAVTAGPGLIGGLVVGLMHAKALALATGRPLFAVNHLEGHALTARLTDGVAFPYLLLLVSGGHSQIVAVEGVGRYRRLATTIDDALGEAFDKTAKLLGLGFPGGPAVERAAKAGDAARFRFPPPMMGDARLAFSFSGLKTALRQKAEALAPLSDQDVADLCAAFQTAVSASVADRMSRAVDLFRGQHPDIQRPALVAAGGVAANGVVRSALQTIAGDHGFHFVAPPLALCGDNGAMIAWAGLERAALGFPSCALDVAPRARWPLDDVSAPVFGAGKKGAKA